MQPPAPSTSHTRNSISLSELDRRRFSGRRGNVITSSLTEEQERRMDGHPWPTTTPYCKTPATLFLLSARTWIHVHDNVTPYTWSIYRFARRGLNDSTPVNRDECVCVLWSLVAFHPRGLLGLVPPCLGNRLSNDKPRPRWEGARRCFLARERDQPRGIRGGFRCPLSFLLRLTEVSSKRWATSLRPCVSKFRYEDPEGNGERSEWSDFERNRARRCFFSIRPGIGSDWAGCVELVLEIWEFFVREFNFFLFFFFSNARISMEHVIINSLFPSFHVSMRMA